MSTPRGKHEAVTNEDHRPHSRACGILPHTHDRQVCARDCPTCWTIPPDTQVALDPAYLPGVLAAEVELNRVAENERFKIWEAGFQAGLCAASGGKPVNPYQFHGKLAEL